mmetsp:Transcript_18499/g.55795  ORF Transcript_18499/g.55795 Transcript_18499/m.55795 type:complete len:90 (+) Transcript_18499:160-429(+)
MGSSRCQMHGPPAMMNLPLPCQAAATSAAAVGNHLGLADRHPPMPRLPLPAHVKAPHELGTLSGTFTELVQVSWHIKCNTFQDATLRQC